MNEVKKKAVVLLSGGLDSATVLVMAIDQGYEVHAISFEYGQRHIIELENAANIAKHYGVKDHRVAHIDLRLFGGSALTDDIDVPKETGVDDGDIVSESIPITYVPARNTIFLSFALAFAETLQAFDIFVGVNALDYSGYPDCRPEYINSFEKLANLATAAATEGRGVFKVHVPLITLSKAEIIQAGNSLGVDYSLTHSCYDPSSDGKACGHCDSCKLRLKGFMEAGLKDPVPYVNS
jgi:7-cyano-7-deazaguanine synthase